MDFRFPPSNEEIPKRKRVQNTTTLVQCDKVTCVKWRSVPYNRRLCVASFPPDDWECADNSEVGKDK